MSNVLNRFRANTEPGSARTDRILDRMVRARERRSDMEFERDMRRNPIWQELSGGTQHDLTDLYNGLRRLGFELSIEYDYRAPSLRLRYGDRIHSFNFEGFGGSLRNDPHFGEHLVMEVVRMAQTAMMEVALASSSDRVTAPRFRPERDYGINFRPGMRIQPPSHAEMLARTGALSSRHLNVTGLDDLLDSPKKSPANRPEGPTEDALEQDYRV